MNYHEVSIDQSVDTRVASVRAAMEELVKIFKKAKSRFYWFDFTVRGQRYRGSTGETKAVRATKVASMKLARAVEHGDLFSAKATVLFEFSARFLAWLQETMVEEKTRKYYRNGCRCALRTLRRMFHKAEEWKLIARAPKIKLLKEHGRDIRLDADAEEKLVQASRRCKWRIHTKELFRHILALMRDTGMRNERELFRIRIENLDWNNRTIFVPDSKTPEGRRLVPLSRRAFEILKKRCGTRTDGWVFPSKRSASGHLSSICNLFRKARNEAGLPKELVLYCARHDYGTRVLTRTGNLAAVMRTMGHRDVRAAMHYQHPELDVVRAALDYEVPADS